MLHGLRELELLGHHPHRRHHAVFQLCRPPNMMLVIMDTVALSHTMRVPVDEQVDLGEEGYVVLENWVTEAIEANAPTSIGHAVRIGLDRHVVRTSTIIEQSLLVLLDEQVDLGEEGCVVLVHALCHAGPRRAVPHTTHHIKEQRRVLCSEPWK